jgi:hypothetical protein
LNLIRVMPAKGQDIHAQNFHANIGLPRPADRARSFPQSLSAVMPAKAGIQ